MPGRSAHVHEAATPQARTDEALAIWQSLVQAAWGLTNVRVGVKDVVPRFAGVAAALEALRARLTEVTRRQTLEIIEDEIHAARADLNELQQLLHATECTMDDILREVWKRKKTLRHSSLE